TYGRCSEGKSRDTRPTGEPNRRDMPANCRPELLDDAGPEGPAARVEGAADEVRAGRAAGEPAVMEDRRRGRVQRAAVEERIGVERVGGLGDVGGGEFGCGAGARVVDERHMAG